MIACCVLLTCSDGEVAAKLALLLSNLLPAPKQLADDPI